MFTQGVMAGGALQTEQVLGPTARANIEESLQKKHEGVENQGKWMLLEQGLTANPFGLNALDAQQVETLNHQIEEIGRAYGVPRPLLGMDETSWGSGISVLGQLFVRYTLNPLFVILEQGIECFLFDDKERDLYEAKYNANALLRGSMTEQAEFFSKALGSGGHQPWMDYQEVRDASDLPAKEIAPNPLTKQEVPEDVTPEST
jgi:HK97 family phage portal protein